MPGAGDGIPTVTTALNRMADAALRSADALVHLRAEEARQASADKAAHDRSTAYGPDWVSGADLSRKAADDMNKGKFGAGNPSGTTAIEASAGLNPLSTDFLDAEGYTVGSHVGQRASQRQDDARTAAEMEHFADELDRAEGVPTTIGNSFRKMAQFIREGRFSGEEAKRYLQAIDFNWVGGAFQELGDPTASPLLKSLISGFINFESSGRIPTP